MSRYIDADWLLCKIYDLVNAINDEAPTIDIVRCKECKWYEEPEHKIYELCVKWKRSNGILLPIRPDDFCSYGERKE